MKTRQLYKILLVSILALGLLLTMAWTLTSAENPEVVLLYTQKSQYPDFAFRLSSTPLALISFIQTGHKALSLLPANRQNIESAFAHARFVIIGTHGMDGGILTDEGEWIGPDARLSPKMKLVYFGSCYFGKNRKLWEGKFPNAKVIGYDQLTYPSVGWKYLVFESWRDFLLLAKSQSN